MTRYGLDMTDDTETIISEGRNLRALPFRTTEDRLSTWKHREDWLESIKRELRFFRVASSLNIQIAQRAKIAHLTASHQHILNSSQRK